jgi:hypothetical protein
MRFTMTFDLPDEQVREGWAPDGEGLGEAAQGPLDVLVRLHDASPSSASP